MVLIKLDIQLLTEELILIALKSHTALNIYVLKHDEDRIYLQFDKAKGKKIDITQQDKMTVVDLEIEETVDNVAENCLAFDRYNKSGK